MTETHLVPVNPEDPYINKPGSQRREKLRQGEAILVRPLIAAMYTAGVMTDGVPIIGQAQVYEEHELLRSIYFAKMVARAQGHNLEVASK
jgi:hypothetical protein